MKSRRRFHGYCQPSARRRSAEAAARAARCDSRSVGFSDVPMQQAARVRFDPCTFDDEEEEYADDENEVIHRLTSRVSQSIVVDRMINRGVTPFENRRESSASSEEYFEDPFVQANEFVTSLSYDSRDESNLSRQEFTPSLPKELILFEPVMEEQQSDEQRDAPAILEVSDCSSTEGSIVQQPLEDDPKQQEELSEREWFGFRFNYLLVTAAIMLADGLQGTHLYTLYASYGFSVASLYSLGFLTGAVTSPMTGPLVDKIGRKKAALIYCALEIFINQLEQYPFLVGLIASRMIGGVTTNLLSTVFETWVDTEYRRRGFPTQKYEILMRDSVIVSNLAAIGSGYFAHELAERYGAVGPFRGAVGCTAVALMVVAMVWSENYGSAPTSNDENQSDSKSIGTFLTEALNAYRADSRVLRVGIIQGFTCGAVQIFIFLWSPMLLEFARSAPEHLLGLDSHGEPAYGLIFGAFMACGVVGGLLAPSVREGVTALLTPLTKTTPETVEVEGEGEVRPMAVEFLAAMCYLICAGLLVTPCFVDPVSPSSFAVVLSAFLVYEMLIGIYMPCEGVIRSIYIPSETRSSCLSVPRFIVNIAVSLGVISTNYVSAPTAFGAVSFLMVAATGLQISLVSSKEWNSIFGRVDRLKRRFSRSMSFSTKSPINRKVLRRTQSGPAQMESAAGEHLAEPKKIR